MKRQLIPALISATSLATSQAIAATAEVRGTWVTTSSLSSGTVATPSTTTTNFKKLRDIGLNSIYMDGFRAGYTYYPSSTLQSIVGADRAPELGTRDLLQETLIQSHRNGMAQLTWYQYGFATYFGNPGTGANPLTNYMQSHGWLLQDSAGNYTNSSNSFSWMNPLVPQVQQFITGIVLDAVKKYDLDGIQFDDRLAWPVQFGYDAYTKAQYKAETGQDVPTTYSDANFKAWRAGKITAFAQQLQTAVKAVNPNIIFSVAPSVYPFSYDSYCVDWPTWRANGQFDEFVPQVYRRNATDFDTDWDGAGTITTGGQVQFMGNRRADFAAGMAIDGSGWTAPFDPNGIKQEITQVRGTTGVAGHVLWYSNGVLNTYPTQLTSFYDVATQGQAARPDQAANWRPLPTVATTAGTNKWNVNVTTAGLYSVIYFDGANWNIFDTRNFASGITTLPISGAQNVELIADHRPASLFSETAWNVDASGNSSAGSNWSFGLVPGGVDAAIKFGYQISAGRTITFDEPMTVGSIKIDNAASYTLAGSSPISLSVSTGAAQLNVITGSHTISAPLTLTSDTNVNVAPLASTLTLSGNLNATGVNITKSGTGTLVAKNIRASVLSITAGKIKIAADGTATGTNNLSSLSITTSAGAKLDLTDNRLIVAGGATPSTTVSNIKSLIIAGRNVPVGGLLDGKWNGGGIQSSSANARFLQDGFESRQIGYALNSSLPFGAMTTFGGQSVSANDILIRYTTACDADLDGKCGDSDVTLVGVYYDSGATTGHTWAEGDFNFDGKIDDSDVTALGLLYNESATPLAPSRLTALYGADFATAFELGRAMSVPEPVLVPLILCIPLMRRRRKPLLPD